MDALRKAYSSAEAANNEEAISTGSDILIGLSISIWYLTFCVFRHVVHREQIGGLFFLDFIYIPQGSYATHEIKHSLCVVFIFLILPLFLLL